MFEIEGFFLCEYEGDLTYNAKHKTKLGCSSVVDMTYLSTLDISSENILLSYKNGRRVRETLDDLSQC